MREGVAPAAAAVIDSLPGARASLARETLSWCDAFWDEARALAWAPPGARAGRVHLVPQSAWYAYGLLLRDAPGDAARAERCLTALCELQYDEPGTAWHGTFARFAETGHPPRDAVMWLHYDPNWRQFLGTTFLALLQDFEPRLSPSLVARIDRSLRLAVTGEPPDRVAASYSNIALMKAFLAVEAGVRLSEPGWVAAGEALANEIADAFAVHGAFEEYNSPTYYGIDLYALALWSERSSSQVLRARGRVLEAALWRDVARWYHAGLRNLCGPYSRSYGMDMTRYVALLGLDVWAAAGAAAAPLPPLDPGAEHGHDLFLGPLTAALGVRVPADARSALEVFPGEHDVAQRVASQPSRRATGWLGADVMIGAEQSETGRLSGWGQYVAATVHWRLPDDRIGWITGRALGAPAGRAGPCALELECPVSPTGNALRLGVDAPGAPPAAFDARRWRLPGLDVEVETDLAGPFVEQTGAATTLVFRPAQPGRAGRLGLRFATPGTGRYSSG